MNSNLLEALVGAVVLIVAGGFLFFAYTRTELRTVDGYEVTAEFNQVGGLTVGSDVRLSGIKVGTVTSQSLDPVSYQALIRMSIDRRIELPEDSSAKITSDGLLGNAYVSLEPGGSPDLLRPGDRIQFTQGSIDLMSLVGEAVFQMGAGRGDGATQEGGE